MSASGGGGSHLPRHVAVLEPYYGGSHRVFVDALVAHSRHRITIATMPARKWKWRMRGAAAWFALQETGWMYDENGRPVDVILCNDMLSAADLRSLLPAALRVVPIVCYFHENQLTYPIAPDDVQDYQYGMTNITSCLAADRVLFNSAFHRSAFVAAADKLMRLMPDCVPDGITDRLLRRSQVAWPPVDVPRMGQGETTTHAVPRILWSHRWEYDKNPAPFFAALRDLADDGVPFELVCVGEQFRTAPPEFAESCRRLGPRLAHAGFVSSRDDYLALLRSCDIAVSTAIQENFGIAMLEAAASGCQPVVPNRLAYPEVIPEAFHPRCLYENDGALLQHLRGALRGVLALTGEGRANLAAQIHGRFGVSSTVPAIDLVLERTHEDA